MLSVRLIFGTTINLYILKIYQLNEYLFAEANFAMTTISPKHFLMILKTFKPILGQSSSLSTQHPPLETKRPQVFIFTTIPPINRPRISGQFNCLRRETTYQVVNGRQDIIPGASQSKGPCGSM